ncbi:phospho-N-acetylmuramoyl-pentapeptide-transferase [Chlamydiifrater phoenicopteri]|uniref:phospho-N-acetylmuramoyl-pentapeptide- transferase n=1 Tax=Chlamydiifrater phoenicopteri TaxID=2681469 RepID=UPI001FE934EC|nr:phospho-N-acetylmuramoyl-pentapeptide-transferase [Chlamydiifrater phoenicopteri]
MAFILVVASFFGLGVRSGFFWLFSFSIVSWSLLGMVDDIVKQKQKKGHGLSAKKKFCFQFLIAFVTVLSFMRISSSSCFNDASSMPQQEKAATSFCSDNSFFLYKVPFVKESLKGSSILGKMTLFCLAIVAIVGTANAVNLTDGLDGLASGCMFLASISFIIMTVLSELLISKVLPRASIEVLLLLSSMAGVCLGFFFYNRFPAKLFMGDTGSMMLGGMLGTCVVFLRQELFLVIVGGVFVAEALSVIIQVASFKIRKKRIFLCAPLHHHFEYKGISENRVVVGFWIAGAIVGVVGVLSSLLSFL